jgi:hypothetical protein
VSGHVICVLARGHVMSAATHKPGNNDRNIKLRNIESSEKYSKCLDNSHPSFHLTMHQLSVISLVYLQTFLIPKYVFIINDNKIKNKIYHIVTIILNSNRKIVETEANSILPIHI